MGRSGEGWGVGKRGAVTSTSLARECVWGPGDWGPDEFLVQSGTVRVITQLVDDAYGAVIGRGDPATPSTGPPELRVGHKGLFFDRLDGGIADAFTGEELPRLEPGARLTGYARNRTLHCDLGLAASLCWVRWAWA